MMKDSDFDGLKVILERSAGKKEEKEEEKMMALCKARLTERKDLHQVLADAASKRTRMESVAKFVFSLLRLYERPLKTLHQPCLSYSSTQQNNCKNFSFSVF
jgi:hypothetical protein